MCGIVGIVGKQSWGLQRGHDDLFEQLLMADTLRGEDSTGAFSVDYKNGVKVVKQATTAGIFIKTQSFRHWKNQLASDARLVIGHNRKATMGSTTTKNAHPFTDGKIVLVHNGYIQNHKELDKEVEVDSESIVTVLAKEQDVLKGLQQLWGAFALAWYNHETKCLYLARNEGRPLAVAHTKDHMFIASEGFMLRWILMRNKVSGVTVVEMPADEVWTISFNPFRIITGKIPAKPIQHSRVPDVYEGYGDSCAMPNTSGTPDAEFELEGDPAANDRPMTELDRAREMAKRLSAEVEAEANRDSIPNEVMIIKNRYPDGTRVLFRPQHVQQSGSYVRCRGEAWIPGKPPVKAIYHVASVEDKEAYLTQGVPLTAVAACPSRLNSDFLLMIKNVVTPSDVFTDVQNQMLSRDEWHMICDHYACHVCSGRLHRLRPDLTMVVKGIKHSYEVTCDTCFMKDIAVTGTKDTIVVKPEDVKYNEVNVDHLAGLGEENPRLREDHAG